jgi:lysophospholipase L1-like esterase
MRTWGRLAIVSAVAAFFGWVVAVRAEAPPRHWVGTWAAAPHHAGQFPADGAGGFENQTIRQIVHVSVGGSAVRLRITNAFGDRAQRFDSVYIGIQAAGARVRAGSNRRLTFGGKTFLVLRKGASAVSDPVSLHVDNLDDLAISLFTAGATGPPTEHVFSNMTSFAADGGDFAADESDAAYASPMVGWWFIQGVYVNASADVKGAVLALGDSLTDGFGSTWDANTRYTDFLARRFAAGPPGKMMGVLNSGITGSRVLGDSPCFGLNVGARLDREVLAATGVSAVIYTHGLNDFGYPVFAPDFPFTECVQSADVVSAEDVIDGMRQVIARVHAAGLAIYGATLNPIKGGDHWSEETEVKRHAVNAWMRTSGEFDGVFDFAAAVADPNDPDSLAPWFDSGDHTHPNDDGYRAMANAVRLSAFR